VSPWWAQLPVRSPVTASMLGAALRGVVGGGGGRARVEAELAERFGADWAVLTASGTAALAVALRSVLGGVAGGRVALPAYCCYDVATAAVGAAAHILTYDLDPATLSPDLDSVRRALDAGAQAVVVAHLYGYPADVPAVRLLAREHGVELIEDAAQGAGGTLGGVRVGSLASLSVLSFGRGKGITTGGGGALLGKGAMPELVETELGPPRHGLSNVVVLAALATFGWPGVFGVVRAAPRLGVGETTYRHPTPSRLGSGVCAAVLPAALAVAATELNRRRENAAAYIREIGQVARVRTIHPLADADPGFLRFPVVWTGLTMRDLTGARALGVMAGYPRALVDVPEIGDKVVNSTEKVPGARLLAERLMTLPTHGGMSPRDVADVCAWLRLAGGVTG